MLAWIFWHTRFADVSSEDYAAALGSFHERIANFAPDGYVGCRSLRYEAVPWLPATTEVYEDWYFVESSASLDRLDEAAVAAFMEQSHERVARLAAAGVAGLYKLRVGTPLSAPSHVTWLTKPRGVNYGAFIGEVATGGAVWSRQMVLGPAPEFCIEDDAPAHPKLRKAIVHALQPASFIARAEQKNTSPGAAT